MKIIILLSILTLSSCSSTKKDYQFFLDNSGLTNLGDTINCSDFHVHAIKYLKSHSEYTKGVSVVKRGDFSEQKVPAEIVSLKPDYLFLKENTYIGLNYMRIVTRTSFTIAYFINKEINEDDVRLSLGLDKKHLRSLIEIEQGTWFVVNEY